MVVETYSQERAVHPPATTRSTSGAITPRHRAEHRAVTLPLTTTQLTPNGIYLWPQIATGTGWTGGDRSIVGSVVGVLATSNRC